jgi:peroxiredoxin Q/BCP
MGRTFEGIHRTSFLINENGVIEKTYLKVKAKSHPMELVEEIKSEKL